MKRHFAEKHNGVKYNCETCDKDFKSKEGLRNHKLTIHDALDICASCVKNISTLNQVSRLIFFTSMKTSTNTTINAKTVKKSLLKRTVSHYMSKAFILELNTNVKHVPKYLLLKHH